MKRIVSFIIIMVMIVGSATQIHAQKKESKEEKKELREKRDAEKKAIREKKDQERKAADAVEDQITFDTAIQALRDQSFVLEANSIQPLGARTFFVNSTTNFISLNNGQAVVQIASNSGYSGPNGIGGITVQGNASNINMKQDKKGNVYFTMNVQGIAISASVMIQLFNEGNTAVATIDPNFTGNDLTMRGYLYPTSMSNIYQGITY